jgi:hypothetical protein
VNVLFGAKMGVIVRVKASAVANAVVYACVKPAHCLNDEVSLCIEP